jgi:hypothetical protein
VFHAPPWTETFENLLVAGAIRQVIRILERESMVGMMMILVAHKTVNADGEILASIAHDIRDHIRFSSARTTE